MAQLKLIVLVFIGVTLNDKVLTSVVECETNADCIDEATCTENFCRCPDGYILSSDGFQCLRHVIGYQAACEDDAQCSYLMGRNYCNSGACDCGSGYRYLHGRCVVIRGLGETCTRDEECHVNNYIGAMVCSEGSCACNAGYYARGGYDCRPEATEINDNCALDMDCMMDNAHCDRYQCTATGSRINRIGRNIWSNTSSSNDIVTYAIGATCSNSADCADVPNSVCSRLTKECVCDRGYYLSGSTCVGEIGTDVGCTQNSDCPFTPRLCRDGACVCPSTHYHNTALTGCIRIAYTPEFPCNDEIGCHIFGAQARCVEIGFERFCRCSVGYELNQETYLCEPSNNGDCNRENCIVSSDCSVTNAVCVNGACTCDDSSRLEGSICLPNIGGACDADSRACTIENATCVNNICSCHDDFTAVDDTTCMQVSSGLYDSCDFDRQCSFVVPDSACDNGECRCATGFAEKDGACLEPKAYGDYCVNPQQCRVALGDNILCRNSICQCPADMIRTNDGLDCRDGAPILRPSTILTLVFISYLMRQYM